MSEEEKTNEIQIDFINEGKPFTIGDWTVRKHRQVLKKMSEYEEKHLDLSESDKDEKYQNLLILEGLKDIDSSIKEQQLENMHPADKTSLFVAIYYSGRKGISPSKEKGGAKNFPKAVQKQ
jgi:hypothetical protein